MFILSRELGQAFTIEDVRVTLITVDAKFVELRLQKATGGPPVVLTVPHQEYVDVCYEARIVFVESRGFVARLGLEAPAETDIARRGG